MTQSWPTVVLIFESQLLLLCMCDIAIIYEEEKQLTGIEVEQTRRIANVRIHVEFDYVFSYNSCVLCINKSHLSRQYIHHVLSILRCCHCLLSF